METQDIEDDNAKIKETSQSPIPQPAQEVIITEVPTVSPPTIVSTKQETMQTSSLPTTVITSQRHRMITTAGHIR